MISGESCTWVIDITWAQQSPEWPGASRAGINRDCPSLVGFNYVNSKIKDRLRSKGCSNWRAQVYLIAILNRWCVSRLPQVKTPKKTLMTSVGASVTRQRQGWLLPKGFHPINDPNYIKLDSSWELFVSDAKECFLAYFLNAMKGSHS